MSAPLSIGAAKKVTDKEASSKKDGKKRCRVEPLDEVSQEVLDEEDQIRFARVGAIAHRVADSLGGELGAWVLEGLHELITAFGSHEIHMVR